MSQTDCFVLHMRAWALLGLYAPRRPALPAALHGALVAATMVFTHDVLSGLSLFFLPPELDVLIEELVFFFTKLAGPAKIITILLRRDFISNLLSAFNRPRLQPDTAYRAEIIDKTKYRIRVYSRILIFFSQLSLLILSNTFIYHVFYGGKLSFLTSSYSVFPDTFRYGYKYTIFSYQLMSMLFHCLYHLSIDSFIVGLMFLTTAHLDILYDKVKRAADPLEPPAEEGAGGGEGSGAGSGAGGGEGAGAAAEEADRAAIRNLTECIKYFLEIEKICKSLEYIFSFYFFSQMACLSALICVCTFRFTLPGEVEYFIFLFYYLFIMILQILVPCWFGTQIIMKSEALTEAAYSSSWLGRSAAFQRTLLVLAERAQHPLALAAWAVVPLSLPTFTRIIDIAYKFFTMLRHAQSKNK